MRYSSNVELQAASEHFEFSSDMIMSDIMREHRAQGRKPSPVTTIANLIDADIGSEVGKLTPPVRIYKMGPDGELVLKEQIQAMTFRRRALESIGGKAFQDRLDEMKRKRMKAGLRSKAKSRATRKRLGIGREPMEPEDDGE